MRTSRPLPKLSDLCWALLSGTVDADPSYVQKSTEHFSLLWTKVQSQTEEAPERAKRLSTLHIPVLVWSSEPRATVVVKRKQGRLRERTKRDESDSGDGSGNVSDAGLDLTRSGHSSRRVQGLWLARLIESDLVRKRPLACPIESDLVRKRPQNILTSTSTGAGWIFEDFLSFDFFSVLHVSLFFFFDHADCGTCFLLAKNGIVIVTRHSESSDENAHTEVQYLPSAAFLDDFCGLVLVNCQS